MADKLAQNFDNHTRTPPPLFLVAGIILSLNVLASLAYLYKHPSYWSGWQVLVAFALAVVAVAVRGNPLVVQDRVIRLEEQLRFERLLPEDLKARVGELERSQFVALRFASDAELPELMRQVLDEKLTDQKEIKKRVRSWRADHLRV